MVKIVIAKVDILDTFVGQHLLRCTRGQNRSGVENGQSVSRALWSAWMTCSTQTIVAPYCEARGGRLKAYGIPLRSNPPAISSRSSRLGRPAIALANSNLSDRAT